MCVENRESLTHPSTSSSRADGLCSDGIVDDFDGMVCCNSECSKCGGKDCKNNLKYLDIGAKVDAANCCMGAIFDNEVYCADNGDKAPCIL